MDKQLFRAIGYNTLKIALAIYFGLLISRATFDNYAKSEEIVAKQKMIASLEEDISYRNNLLQYYQSPVYLELEARRQLNYKAAGERVIVLGTNEELASTGTKISTAETASSDAEDEDNTPNYLKWWQYFNQ